MQQNVVGKRGEVLTSIGQSPKRHTNRRFWLKQRAGCSYPEILQKEKSGKKKQENSAAAMFPYRRACVVCSASTSNADLHEGGKEDLPIEPRDTREYSLLLTQHELRFGYEMSLRKTHVLKAWSPMQCSEVWFWASDWITCSLTSLVGLWH